MIETVQQLGVDRYNVRKPDRIRIRLKTRLRISGQPDLEISLCNISRRGFMAEGDAAVATGTDALLFLPGIGWTLANVRWRSGDRFGARFSDAVDMRQFWRANPPRTVSHLDQPSEAA